jgi:hypothetical protein
MKHSLDLPKIAQDVATFNAANKLTKRGWLVLFLFSKALQ